eukprot:Phypoly_transcript_01104.p1 GENE.Phypoly_transcript_01104~~Phypoly_transcript_01104.p1  ORF type:complete len:992 (-),score=189.41 Phypoly_transcript_01104:668-3643(-)
MRFRRRVGALSPPSSSSSPSSPSTPCSSPVDQDVLEVELQSLFPGSYIHKNRRKTTHIISPFTGNPLELDFWLPEFNLAFEFQDIHHYVPSWYSAKKFSTLEQEDDTKYNFLAHKGHTLIQIPYWWNGATESLIATIKSHRPDLLQHLSPQSSPIPSVPPTLPNTVGGFIPNIERGLMQVSFVFIDNFNPHNWWASEKYDGIRAIWNPHLQKIYSRFGIELQVLKFYVHWFPSIFVDTEIWFGRDTYRICQQILQQKIPDSDNPQISKISQISNQPPRGDLLRNFRVSKKHTSTHPSLPSSNFLPTSSTSPTASPTTPPTSSPSPSPSSPTSPTHAPTSPPTFPSTSPPACSFIPPTSPSLSPPTRPTAPPTSPADDSPIRSFASSSPLPVICLQENLRFVAFDEPVQLSPENNELEFRFASMLHNIHPSNSCIIPTAPFLCSDMQCAHAILHDLLETQGEGLVLMRPTSVYIPGYSENAVKLKKVRDHEALVVSGYKDGNSFLLLDPTSQRTFTAQLAPEMDNEPKPKKGDVVTFSFMRYSPTGTPWAPAIIRTRPDLEWKLESLNRRNSSKSRLIRSPPPMRITKPHGYWSIHDSINIRRFLDSFAAKNNFDPLVPENWYRVKLKDITNEKYGVYVLPKYGSLFQAIADMYPNIGIDITKFPKVNAKYYSSKKIQRSFLDSFAAQNGFDPLVAENWYSVTVPAMNLYKNVKAIRRKYGSLRAALIVLYPELSFDISKFSKMPQNYWQPSAKRNFFDTLAKKRGFDPLIPENWYTINKKAIQGEKNGNTILHGQTIAKSLQSAYPNIGLDVTKLPKRKYWTNFQNRKTFFDQFAAKRGFDPRNPEKWYCFSQADFLAEEGGKTLLHLYNFSYITALLDVYPDIGLHQMGFPVKPQKYWKHTSNMRNFCDAYAAKKGFDPLQAINWYLVDRAEFMEEKGAWRVAKKYGSLEGGLVQLYPEVPLSRKKFISSSHTRKREQLGNQFLRNSNVE